MYFDIILGGAFSYQRNIPLVALVTMQVQLYFCLSLNDQSQYCKRLLSNYALYLANVVNKDAWAIAASHTIGPQETTSFVSIYG